MSFYRFEKRPNIKTGSLLINIDNAVCCAKQVIGDIMKEYNGNNTALSWKELTTDAILEKINDLVDLYLHYKRDQDEDILSDLCDIYENNSYILNQIEAYKVLRHTYYNSIAALCFCFIRKERNFNDKAANALFDKAEEIRREADIYGMNIVKTCRTHARFNLQDEIDDTDFTELPEDSTIPAIRADLKKVWLTDKYWSTLRNYIKHIIKTEIALADYMASASKDKDPDKTLLCMKCIESVNIFFEVNKDNSYINIKKGLTTCGEVPENVNIDDVVRNMESYRYCFVEDIINEVIDDSTPILVINDADKEEKKKRVIKEFSTYAGLANSIAPLL